MPAPKYDCLKCVGYCCAIYERVAVTDKDLLRLARYFGVSPETAKRRYTRMHSGERVLRRTPDPLFGESCMFQDPEKRLCSIYEGRPQVCREWPSHGNTARCVYYDILQFERRQQDNPDVVPLVHITFLQENEE